ncbi:unnamed protein product [Amaranthus hypochondriacus]
MGKRVKKKAARKEKDKEKRGSALTPKPIHEEESQSSVIADDVNVVQKDRKVCVHLENAVDLECVLSKIESADSTCCEYCRESVKDRKPGKGKNKLGKKGASESKATWVCLQCGKFSCGGVGFPNSPQSHALRHVRQSRHPLVIQVENPHLRWCFSCSTLLAVEKAEDPAEQKDGLLDIVKLLKKKSPKAPSADVEDIWFGSGDVVNDVKSENKVVSVANGKDFYSIRGLVNLGNTCFFNSVMQNLLAMNILREYLLKFEGSMGPLTSALKKIFIEISLEYGVKNVINPKSLFGSVCAKAPQFRGGDQQDSHELLRYLLDGMSSEELYANKSKSSFPEHEKSPCASATFVDAIFGGQTSSTVCCVECGHSSVVYEPFLDLSLPVPTKKPLSKKVQPVARTKKKLPPKRGGKAHPKPSKNGDVGIAPSCSNTSSSTGSSSNLKGNSLGCASSADLVEPSSVVHGNSKVTQGSDSIDADYVGAQVPHRVSQDADDMSWLDFIEPVPQGDDHQEADSLCWLDFVGPGLLSDDPSLAVESEKFSVTQDLRSEGGNHDTVSLQDTTMSCIEANLSHNSETNGDNFKDIFEPAQSGGEVSVHLRGVNHNLESTANACSLEHPLQVQSNAILLLTYKEDGATEGEGLKIDTEISSSVVGYGEDTLGFDGLGDLFNEPEVVETGVKNIQVGEHLGNGFLVGNNTESDPDEVDDTTSSVSVESCLAHFIKPELLCGEHAWHCENCSKLFNERRGRMEKNRLETMTDLSNDKCWSSEVLPASDDPLYSSNVFLVNHNDVNIEMDEKLKNFDARPINGNGPNLPQGKEKICVPECGDFSPDVSIGKSVDFHCNNHLPDEGPSRLGEKQESREDGGEEVDLKCVKVMRDATKRILISKSPSILTIHLKRFRQDAVGRLNKLNGHVVFKEFLDVGPFMDYRSTERGNCIYRLIGVVVHSGTMRNGHYVAYVRGNDKQRGRSGEENGEGHSVWYYASDTYVRVTNLEEVLRSEAYILFYEKVKP